MGHEGTCTLVDLIFGRCDLNKPVCIRSTVQGIHDLGRHSYSLFLLNSHTLSPRGLVHHCGGNHRHFYHRMSTNVQGITVIFITVSTNVKAATVIFIAKMSTNVQAVTVIFITKCQPMTRQSPLFLSPKVHQCPGRNRHFYH